MQSVKKHWQYLKYVIRHKWYVFWACIVLHVPIWIAFFHDWVKFLPCEWLPYVNFFYGSVTREEAAALDYNFPVPDDVELAFEYAWNHHQKSQKHHWQYWIRLGDDGTTRILPMPDMFVREMVADWKGAGRALGKPDYQKWYTQNYHTIQLHPDTRKQVDKLLKVDFSEDELNKADEISELESWTVQSAHEAALHIYRSRKRRIASSLGVTVPDWEL